MKKMIFSAIALVTFSIAGMVNEVKSQVQNFEESVVFITKGCIVKEKMYAKTLQAKNFDKSIKMESVISINQMEYTDNGLNNDLKANDGIYTSVKLFDNNSFKENVLLKNDSFKYEKELNSFISSSTSKIVISCKIRRVRSGTTILGTDCSTNWCIELYDCELSIEF